MRSLNLKVEFQEFVRQEQQREERALEQQCAKEEMKKKIKLEMLHEKEMATLHLEADKAKAEGLDNSTRSLDNSRLGIKMPKLSEFPEAEECIDAYLTRMGKEG